MKWAQRIFFFIVAAAVLMAPQTSQINSYVDGNVLTAAQLNAEFGNIYSTINGLDEDNFLSTTDFPATFINAAVAGDGLGRDSGTGVMEVNVDASTIEINADTLRVPTGGITTTQILNDTIAAGDIATSGVATDEILDGTIATADLGGSLAVKLDAGLLATPSLSFTSDTDKGIYSPANNELDVVAAGATIAKFVSSGGTTSIQAVAGAVTVPSYTFQGDTNTGMYRSAGNQIAFTSDGTLDATVDDSGINVEAGVATGGNDHYIKWKVFTGDIAPDSASTLDTNLSNIVSVSGFSEHDGNDSRVPMRSMASSADAGASDAVHFGDPGATSSQAADEILLRNLDTNSTNTYWIVVMYQ